MTGARREFGLDLLRCTAILLVLLMHAGVCVPGMPDGLKFLLHYGWLGVDLFFVLSGYLIGSQLAAPSADDRGGRFLLAFWRRRWTRTLPLYFVVLFIYVVVKPRLFQAPFVGDPWRFALFVQNFQPLNDFAQSWSLCIEEQFYLFVPLLFYPFRFRPRTAVWLWSAFWLLSLAVRFWQWRSLGWPVWNGGQSPVPVFDTHFRFNTLGHLDGLAAGMFLSATRERWQAWPRSRRAWLGGFGAALVALFAVACGYCPEDLRAVVVFSGLSLGFALALIGAGVLPECPLAIRYPVERIALWSYGAYLWNSLLVRFFTRYPPPVPWPLGVLAFVALTLLISFVTYHAVERPGLRLREL